SRTATSNQEASPHDNNTVSVAYRQPLNNDLSKPEYLKNSRSHSNLRRIAAENSAQAVVSVGEDGDNEDSQQMVNFGADPVEQPTFVASPPMDPELDGGAGHDKHDESEGNKQYKSAIGRHPTPFPRKLRDSPEIVEDYTTRLLGLPVDSHALSRSEEGSASPLKPASSHIESDFLAMGTANFDAPSAPVSTPSTPGKQKIRPKIVWDDDDDGYIPPDDDKSLDAQWLRIIRGAPPLRANVMPTKDAISKSSRQADASAALEISRQQAPSEDVDSGSSDNYSEADPEEDKLQERFWARAIRPSKSGSSTPYSPRRTKSVVEMSSSISPKDLAEWMRWQGDNSTLGLEESGDTPDERVVPNESKQQQLPTPPSSKHANAGLQTPDSRLADASLEPPAGSERYDPAYDRAIEGGDTYYEEDDNDSQLEIWHQERRQAVEYVADGPDATLEALDTVCGIVGFEEEVMAADFVGDISIAIASGTSMSLYDQRYIGIVHNARNSGAVYVCKGDSGESEIQAISTRGDFVAFVDDGGRVGVFDITDPEMLTGKSARFSNDGHDAMAACVCFHPEEPVVATGAFDRQVCVWDVASEKVIRRSVARPIVESAQQHVGADAQEATTSNMVNPPFVYALDFVPGFADADDVPNTEDHEQWMVVSGHADGRIMCTGERSAVCWTGCHSYSITAL
ncbi:hypothetical protein GGI22_003553, partial [Coemansia erecta]